MAVKDADEDAESLRKEAAKASRQQVKRNRSVSITEIMTNSEIAQKKGTVNTAIT